MNRRTFLGTAGLAAALALAAPAPAAWPRHTIDDSSRGADGVRLRDVEPDGDPDIVTGWEEGGATRLYLNPGPSGARERWPAVTVGKTPSVEDAVFGDFDGDGAVDVVSCCEGRMQAVFVHWAPKEPDRYLDPEAWTTKPLCPGSVSRMMWMFSVPAQVDGKGGLDLVAAGKGKGAAVGWFQPAAHPRGLGGATWHPLRKVGWVMSIVLVDMDGEGNPDVLVSDRKGPARGVFWLEHPGDRAEAARGDAWKRHDVGARGREVMFLDEADLDGDGRRDVVVAAKPRDVLFLRRLSRDGTKWEEHTIRLPETAGTAKAVAVGDIDGDGRPDLVFSCEGAKPPRPGVMWLSYAKSPTETAWQAHDISGPEGVKFDRLELVDLDADGDPDVLTCEERAGLGVIWYENPDR